MQKITIKSKNNKELIDITEIINDLLRKDLFVDGVVNLFVTHSSCALTTANLDPGTDLDALDVFERIIPKIDFRHQHDPAHTPDHILSSIIGPSIVVPVQSSTLALGTWQRIVLVELNGPKDRHIVVSPFKTETRRI